MFPPSLQINPETKQCEGKNIDITRKILSDYNIKLNIVCVPAARIFRMIESSEIDLTINLKSTRAIKSFATFVDKPYSQIVLNLYSYKKMESITSVSVVRGYDYAGHRQLLKNKNIDFIDLPNTLSSIKVFLRMRSDALLSYEKVYDYYLEKIKSPPKDNIIVKPLSKVNTYFAIAKGSKKHNLLLEIFQHYIENHKDQSFLNQAQ